MMPTPILIIITGLPCTGKTTLGKKIAMEFQLPFICRDNFKEILFDTLGFKNRAWSKKIGRASYSILYHITEQNLKANKSIMLETNFDPESASIKLNQLKKKYNFMPFQIRCFSEDNKILTERYKQRANSNERHPGHLDSKNIREFASIFERGKIDLLNIGGTIYDLDTTNFDNIDYKKIFESIKSMLNHKKI